MRRNRSFERIKNIRGEGHIDTALTIFIVAILLVVSLNVFTLFQLKHNVNLIANEMIECATTYGRISTETSNRLNELKLETGINPIVDYTGTSYHNRSTGTVQLGNTMVVTVSANFNLVGLGMVTFPVNVSSTQSGLSQVYWK